MLHDHLALLSWRLFSFCNAAWSFGIVKLKTEGIDIPGLLTEQQVEAGSFFPDSALLELIHRDGFWLEGNVQQPIMKAFSLCCWHYTLCVWELMASTLRTPCAVQMVWLHNRAHAVLWLKTGQHLCVIGSQDIAPPWHDWIPSVIPGLPQSDKARSYVVFCGAHLWSSNLIFAHPSMNMQKWAVVVWSLLKKQQASQLPMLQLHKLILMATSWRN